MNVRAPRKGETIELAVDGIDDKGLAFGQIDGRTVRVRHGVPGSRIKALVHRRRRKEIEASVEELIEPGTNFVEPRCEHFGGCGGELEPVG